MAVKENIKENVVSAPTLFIGVGGTGSDIVTKVAEMCRGSEKDNVNFVCLDTNVNDLRNVLDSDSHIYAVQTSNTQTVGNYLDYDADALNNWFPKNAVLYDKTVSEGAGQVRAISRLAFNASLKVGKLQPLMDAIDDLFRKDGKDLKQALRVVFASTSSGGTGSGLMLPLAMFVRDYVTRKYPNTAVIVRALVLLPETLDSVITSSVEKESQRRNAYATIKEINAFMIKGSGFTETCDELKQYRDLHVDITVPGSNELKSLSLLPFDFCFLLDGQDAQDSTMISKGQYTRQAAQALYEQNIGPMQRGAFSIEDNIIKELSNNYGRNRFGGIGAAVLRYPYQDVVQYVANDWAMSSIGGEGEAAKWKRYDNLFERKRLEAEKKELPITEQPKLEEVYVTEINNGKDAFSKDLRGKYLAGAELRVNNYLTAIEEEMKNLLLGSSELKKVVDAARMLSKEVPFTTVEQHQGKASEYLGRLRRYENFVRQKVQKSAERAADTVIISEQKTALETSSYSIEQLLKNAQGEVGHPNAIRYMLYLAKSKVDAEIRLLDSKVNDELPKKLKTFGNDVRNEEKYDAAGTKKVTEGTLEELCDSEAKAEKKGAAYEDMCQKINTNFKAYHKTITDYFNSIAKLEACRAAASYLKDLCEEFKNFYATFADETTQLCRDQDKIANSLGFEKGDTVLNICASRAMLDELCRTTAAVRSKEDMLDPELNAKIFDAVKANVDFERETRNADFVEEDKRSNIFRDILVGYFRDTVAAKCDTIDMNIIEAIAMENRLASRIKARENSSGTVFDNVTKEQNVQYIRDMVSKGSRLAAPGIQRLTGEESREINLAAYSKEIAAMREYDASKIIPNGTAVDTVSRYELHFFNALYNLTPDKLSKFAAARTTETGTRPAGLYHNAYITYGKRLGADSRKSMVSTTHIDKRWDSVAVMPELDFEYQSRYIMKIHKALIYALVHKMIAQKSLSSVTNGKKVFRYENTDERFVDLIVSNGTLCDEFYEVLDALYISPSIVENIEENKIGRRAKDMVRNSSYDRTAFKKDLDAFELTIAHEGKASLFEIPVLYYNSLPSSLRYDSEMFAMVDAVIEVFREELCCWESENDAKFLLCDILRQQFDLLMENYPKYVNLNKHIDASESLVIDTIYRRVRSTISTTPEPEDYQDVVDNMKRTIANANAL